MKKEKTRCSWCKGDELYKSYHDEEWGVPLIEENKLFEFLLLEGAQAGLSWITILKRREDYRKAYKNFSPEKVASFKTKEVETLLHETNIIRNRRKVESSVQNAKVFLQIQDEFGGLAPYVWSFVDHTPIQNKWKTLREVPAQTERSQALSKDLKRRGMSFVGPTIMYAFMQATGLVNDHTVDCFRYKEVKKLKDSFYLK